MGTSRFLKRIAGIFSRKGGGERRPAELVPLGLFALAIGYTDSTVRKFIRMGMPVVAVPTFGGKKTYLIPVDEAIRWAIENGKTRFDEGEIRRRIEFYTSPRREDKKPRRPGGPRRRG